MSDPTNTYTAYTAAAERERLGTQYRAAYRALRNGTGDESSVTAAADDIYRHKAVFEHPDTPENFIEVIQRLVGPLPPASDEPAAEAGT